MTKLKKFLDRYLPFPADLLPTNSYLVGGVVRDILLDRTREYLDLDFVTPHSAIATAKKISREYKVGFVVLDQERNIARAVFPPRQSELGDFPPTTIDIAQQDGDSVNGDLGRRDYTINAIAFDYATNETIDPFAGQQDLEKGVIRMISSENLRSDPLRLLRGYRQACQLNFTIEPETRNTIKQLAPLLDQVAEERVHTELGYLLSHPNGSDWLSQAYEDKLLKTCFPHLQESQLHLLTQIDSAVSFLESNNKLTNAIDGGRTASARLACLVNQNPELADDQLTALKYSRQEIKAVTTTLKNISSLQTEGFRESLRQQYFFFKNVGDIFAVVALFALANNIDRDLVLMLCDRYDETQDAIAHPQPLLTGNDIIKSLNISPSPLIGEMLTEVQVAYIEGEIDDQQQGIEWLRKKYSQVNL